MNSEDESSTDSDSSSDEYIPDSYSYEFDTPEFDNFFELPRVDDGWFDRDEEERQANRVAAARANGTLESQCPRNMGFEDNNRNPDTIVAQSSNEMNVDDKENIPESSPETRDPPDMWDTVQKMPEKEYAEMTRPFPKSPRRSKRLTFYAYEHEPMKQKEDESLVTSSTEPQTNEHSETVASQPHSQQQSEGGQSELKSTEQVCKLRRKEAILHLPRQPPARNQSKLGGENEAERAGGKIEVKKIVKTIPRSPRLHTKDRCERRQMLKERTSATDGDKNATSHSGQKPNERSSKDEKNPSKLAKVQEEVVSNRINRAVTIMGPTRVGGTAATLRREVAAVNRAASGLTLKQKNAVVRPVWR